MTTAEKYWIEKQLEPDDILVTGKHKREPRRVAPVLPPPDPYITEEEDNRRQDEYLRRCGADG